MYMDFNRLRSQYVRYDKYDSEVLNVFCCVPQGSVLGPKLFTFFINDICKVSKILESATYMGEVKTPIFLNVNNEEINIAVVTQLLFVLID